MAETLLALVLLACPVGMGLMMWLMNRGGQPPSGEVTAKQAEEIALQAQIDQLEAELGRAGGRDAPRRDPSARPLL